jgi:asparagine synthase (glutamine-hydrolysing)
MCGISGEVRFDGRRADLAGVCRVAAGLGSRGPDGSGLWNDGWAALGHRRLSIVDPSPAGAQPMVDDDLGLAVVFNGCIYNHEELRGELSAAGYKFRSASDTEVIPAAYHHWGNGFVDHLVGMFAIALVDRARHRVVLARDRLGIKPLYLAQSPQRLAFASSLPALVRAGHVDTEIDLVALHHYLTWHSIVPAPRTLLRGVQKLPPATVRTLEADGTVRDRVYWQPDYVREPRRAGMTARDWEEEIHGALRTAVERRLVADVPVGVLLSGGLDSSLIVALLAEVGRSDVPTFSIGFEASEGEQGDEFTYSDVVARTFGTDHHRIRIDQARLESAVEPAVAAMTEPMGTHDAVAFYLLSEEVSRSVKVVQSGQGADEVFGGYGYHQPFTGAAPDAVVDLLDATFADRPHRELADVLEPDYLCTDDASRRLAADRMRASGATAALDRILRFDTHTLMPDDPVKRVDSMTMAWGLEARVPFLDQDVVELAAACPPELKAAHGGKGVLKELGRRLLPVEVVDRPKGYFPVPAVRHLSGTMLTLARDALYSPSAKARGMLKAEYVDRLLTAPDEHHSPTGANLLWQLAVLELWLQANDIG